MLGRGFPNQSVDIGHQPLKVGPRLPSLRSQGSLKVGHDQGCGDSFSTHIANGDTPCTVSERKEIIVVTPNATSRLVEASDAQAWNDGRLLRKRRSLNIPGNLQVTINPFRLYALPGGCLQKSLHAIS